MSNHQRHDVLQTLARGRYAVIIAQARLGPNTDDYAKMDRLLESIDTLAGLWTSEPEPDVPLSASD